MLLALNIGNTNLAVAVESSKNVKRFPIIGFDTVDDFIKVLDSNLPIKKAIICSVIPNLALLLQQAIEVQYSLTPQVVNVTDFLQSSQLRVNFSHYDIIPPSTLGSDRMMICEAAFRKYRESEKRLSPIIVFDFGTATTINVIDKEGAFKGGWIIAGVMTGIQALSQKTAQLFCPSDLDNLANDVQTRLPLLGNNTEDCIKSGAVFGNAIILDGTVRRIEEVIGKSTVIATGGNAKIILPACETKVFYEPELLMEGLFELGK
ncbi:MAG: type III pantothenate kinase [Oscillospiraceae bacterium]|nr:type III pantothenate kinase [Oscillospiraceae bacterium]